MRGIPSVNHSLSQEFFMRDLISPLSILALCCLMLACGEKPGPMEKSGQAIDKAAEKTGEVIKEGAQKTGESLEKAGEKVQDAAK
jgi:hypothetical protein